MFPQEAWKSPDEESRVEFAAVEACKAFLWESESEGFKNTNRSAPGSQSSLSENEKPVDSHWPAWKKKETAS